MANVITHAQTVCAGDVILITHTHPETVVSKNSRNGTTEIVSLDARNKKHTRRFHDLKPVAVRRNHAGPK